MRSARFVRLSIAAATVVVTGACAPGAQPAAPTSPPAATVAAAKPAAATSAPAAAPAAVTASPAAAATPAGAAAVSGPPIKVNIAYNKTELQHLPLQIARDQKLFEKYGLAPEISEMEGGTEMSKVLLSGKLDFIASNVNEVADAHAAGEDERIIADSYDVPTDGLFAGSKIKSKDDLKGKQVGISKFGGASELTTRLLIRKMGFDDTKDVTIVQVGGESARVKAALAGTVDAVPADSSGKRLLEAKGLKMIESLADPNGPGGDPHGLITTGTYIKQNPEAVRRMVMAYSHGMWLLKNKPDIANVSIQKMANTTDRDEVADIQKEMGALQKMPPLSGESAIAYTLKLLEKQDPGAAKQKPTDLFDNSFVDALVKAGFYEQLGR